MLRAMRFGVGVFLFGCVAHHEPMGAGEELSAGAVGEICQLEYVPAGGFLSSEVYLEHETPRCASRTCLTYQLNGAPSYVDAMGNVSCDAETPELCASLEETEARVYCSCRCAVPEGTPGELCECPSGFSCVDLIDSPLAGSDVVGSYCVRDGT